MLPYTGTYAALGKNIDEALRLAINEKGGKLGGRDVEYVVLDDLGDGADARVLAVVPRHEQDALLTRNVDRERHVHVGEDNDVVQWDEQQLAHSRFTLLGQS